MAKFGVSPELLDTLVDAQDGRCAACQEELNGQFHVDHDHAVERESGEIEVRGLLCRGCNSGLGLLGDQAEHAARALIYILRGSSATASREFVGRVIEMITDAPIALSG